MTDLEKTLVLRPTYDGPSAIGSQTGLKLLRAGCRLVDSTGCSDVARHRCEIATSALPIIEKGNHDWVLWLDGDIGADVQDLEDLIALSRAVSKSENVLMSASYSTRANPKLRAACPAGAEVWRYGEHLAMPIIGAGMGFLLQPAKAFYQQVMGAPFVEQGFHAICESKAVHGQWLSEDFDYCARARASGQLTYVALTVRVTHEMKVGALPEAPDPSLIKALPDNLYR